LPFSPRAALTTEAGGQVFGQDPLAAPVVAVVDDAPAVDVELEVPAGEEVVPAGLPLGELHPVASTPHNAIAAIPEATFADSRATFTVFIVIAARSHQSSWPTEARELLGGSGKVRRQQVPVDYTARRVPASQSAS